jgi:hypothetical protein
VLIKRTSSGKIPSLPLPAVGSTLAASSKTISVTGGGGWADVLKSRDHKIDGGVGRRRERAGEDSRDDGGAVPPHIR